MGIEIIASEASFTRSNSKTKTESQIQKAVEFTTELSKKKFSNLEELKEALLQWPDFAGKTSVRLYVSNARFLCGQIGTRSVILALIRPKISS